MVVLNRLSGDAAKIYALFGDDVISVEQITKQTDCDIAKVLSALTELEIWEADSDASRWKNSGLWLSQASHLLLVNRCNIYHKQCNPT